MTSELFFEKLQVQFSDGLPFVAYRKPNESDVNGLLQSDNSLHHTSDFTENGFVFAPFDDKLEAVLIPLSNSNIIQSKVDTSIANEASNSKIGESIAVKDNHIKLVEKGIKTINSGVLKKVVLSRTETISLKEENPIHIFQKLLSAYHTAFVYLWYHPQVGAWLGATPETLLKVRGNQISTMALAGTQPYTHVKDVVWGAKEQEEQQMVTNYILNSLQSSAKDIHASETITVKAGNLLHLQTQITARLNTRDPNKQLIESLHPTPAICGLPRMEAKQFILENEDYERQYYTGFLGELNMKEIASRNRNKRNIENNAYSSVKTVTNLFVNLRCMQIKDGHASIYVGGGITKDSIPEQEWKETINKANTMKKVL